MVSQADENDLMMSPYHFGKEGPHSAGSLMCEVTKSAASGQKLRTYWLDSGFLGELCVCLLALTTTIACIVLEYALRRHPQHWGLCIHLLHDELALWKRQRFRPRQAHSHNPPSYVPGLVMAGTSIRRSSTRPALQYHRVRHADGREVHLSEQWETR